MYLSNELMAQMTELQVDINAIAEIAGADGVGRLQAAAKVILAQLGADESTLTAEDRAAAAMTGTPLSVVTRQRARKTHDQAALDSLSPEEQAVARMLGSDPRDIAAAKQNAARELFPLGAVAGGELLRRCGGDVLVALSTAKREGLLP